MKKTIEKIKGKGIKLSARIFGAMTACFSTIVAAYADVEDTEAGGVWSNIAAWIKKKKGWFVHCCRVTYWFVCCRRSYMPQHKRQTRCR